LSRPRKLSETDVKALLAWAAIGTSHAAAARYFKVSPDTIRNYLNGVHKPPHSTPKEDV